MTEALQVFSYKGSNVRTVMIGGEPWLVAKDVADILGIQNIRQNMDELDEDEKGVSNIYTPGGMQSMTIINESGLYKLTFKSRKPAAKEFTRWVTHEVLPSIRKTGSYTIPQAEQELEPLNIRVRIAGVLQRLALQVSSKVEREIINREAYKYATGQELPVKEPVAKVSNPRYWTAQQLASILKWPVDAVMHRAENLGLTKKPVNGYWEGDTWYFSKEGRKKFLELVQERIVKIADGYKYYEDGHKFIYWSFDADAARIRV